MKLTEKCSEDSISTSSNNVSNSINLNSLYCSHLWSNSKLRNTILTAPCKENESVKYCYTCRGKIRKYEVKSYENIFTPNDHSTPNRKDITETNKSEIEAICFDPRRSQNESEYTNIKKCIPTISHQIDLELCQKFTSYDIQVNESNQRLRKNYKGIGCLINFSQTDSPKKKRKKIQACSISVMIIAIVVISFILVNFTTPQFTQSVKDYSSTIVVPIENINYTETSFATTDILNLTKTESLHITTTELFSESNKKRNSTSSIISKIRKNIKTYPRASKEGRDELKTKEMNNPDTSQQFCSCQKSDICMLDESTGKSICRRSADEDDPTGCGGLCAFETEACHLVDKERGVRVCRSLSPSTCTPDEWKCRNGLCVSAEARCDGSIQCYDLSDEMQCECDPTEQFHCGNSISCFPNSKLCDGAVDCWDAYDEVNCTAECPKDQFTCKNDRCIPFSRFCDGLTDCSDGSDEPQGCGICGAHEIQCKNQRCVSKAVLCDGRDNCGDLSDELNCPNNS
ncbi:hypothetical protein K1T71_001898 [Dendrolimus kikuchii]|uniref:Uncharacterized protein n=1 Tax=Dendrolimus kikuchii TaxID=765133 RepID=A0ACC1DFJ5_9NEOP|nr:hypothetical protein K1T71_001898 [Dendrolimus kikuchii]